MSGENFGDAGAHGAGEQRQWQGEYARGILQKEGKKILGALEAELQEMPRAELMQSFGIEPTTGMYFEVEGGLRNGMGTDEAYKAIFGERYQSEAEAEPEAPGVEEESEIPEQPEEEPEMPESDPEQPEESGEETPGEGMPEVEEDEVEGELGEGEKPEGEQAPQTETEKAIAEAVAANKDRYGNSISEESIRNLQKLAGEDPAKFAAEIMELTRDQRRDAAEKGYMAAQKEIAEILEGRKPEEFLELYAHDINRFRGEITKEEAKIAAINHADQMQQWRTDEARRFKEKQLNEMRELLYEMERKYALVANLQKGSEGAVPVPIRSTEEILGVPEDEEQESQRDLRLELLDANDPTYGIKAKMRRGEFERVTQFMVAAEAERLMQQLKNTEELEQQLKQKAQHEFATPTGDGAGTAEEIARAAEAAGGVEKPGRFDKWDDELQQMERQKLLEREREGLIQRLKQKLLNRGFKRKAKH